MKRVDVVSAILTNESGQILIVKNRKGDSFYWGPPGGAVEVGETLEQAVVREVKEETGYDIRVGGLSSVREVLFEERGHHVLFFTFFAQIIDDEIQINDPDDDIAEVMWADFPKAKELMPFLVEALKLETESEKALPFYAFEGTR
ncbi:DNA mismatch repair protein MutT [Brevibacillus choshinensis]|uniref:DNA mismatch repair protein MutT n=1 Tax=Brevibacillus choshinensis TaxID=54911 RepID=A0ABR5NAB9_BRECH|nr:NUDIX hydrolase [Brevibacillus choshinensis]KQL48502.1 DNA mismatch repair protein MutT [Brevibacillus choshinensis]